jgi:serine/threonine protein kinase
MAHFEKILDLADQWDDTPVNQRGTPDLFCQDHPELIDAFKHFLEQRSLVARVLQGESPICEPESLMGNFQSDRFQLVRFHDSGGLGWVFLAEDRELGRAVAVKCLQPVPAADPAATRRFLREAEVTAKLEHPGVIPVYGMDKSRRQAFPYYAMRFVEGETMRSFIRRLHSTHRSVDWTCLDAVRLLKSFVNVCDAVAYAHSRGVIHRDLKPLNIMMGKFGETFVMDWGLAKSIEDDEYTSSDGQALVEGVPVSMTQTGRAVGTVGFMSPEQARGDWKEVGPASDQFSLGVVLYEILTNETAFRGPSSLEDSQACRFPRPRARQTSIPRSLEAICLKAMSSGPTQRYSSVQDLKTDIEQYLADLPVQAYRDSSIERMQRLMRRHKTAVTLGSFLSLVIVGLLAFFLEQSFRKNRDLESANLRWQKATILAEQESNRAHESAEQANTARNMAEKNAAENEELVNRLLSVMNLADPRLQSKVVTVADLVTMLTENEGFYQGLSPQQRFRLKLGFARSLMGFGQRERAAKAFEEVIELSSQVLDPSDVLNLHIRRDFAALINDPDRSINILRELVDDKRFPVGQRAYVGIKLIERLHSGSHDQELNHYLSIVEELCSSIDSSDQLTPFRFAMIHARILYDSGRAAEALPICRKLATEIPNGISPAVAVEPIIQLGECLERLSQWKEAMENYQKAEDAYIQLLGAKHPVTVEVADSRKRAEAQLAQTANDNR